MARFEPPSRKDYIRQQKAQYGRRAFGVFPAQYPKEILWAWNILPVEIWDPPLEPVQANAHLQPYICSVVRSGLELILQGHCDALDGFLFPHTCDSIQNLASIVNDYLGLDKPCYFFYHPKAPYRASSRLFYLEQLKILASLLEKRWGPAADDEFEKRMKQARQIGALMKEAYDLRAKGALRATNEEFYRVIRQGEYLHPDDFLPLLHEFLKTSKGGSRTGPAVVLSGILPNPPEILRHLDELRVVVGEDDLLNCGRRLVCPPVVSEGLFESLADGYLLMPPCSTRDSSLQERLDFLLEKVRRADARGIIFWMVKFCEPELFDVPQIAQELKRRGLAILVVDTEINQGLSGQLRTRLEAFVEMMA
jgi:benzoyl-CoA reductase/2-hydroxyglutaryl-CoA dehydratase subunit BcrC/BadD/HgdB